MPKKCHFILALISGLISALSIMAAPVKGQPLKVQADNTTHTQILGNPYCLADCTISGGIPLGDSLFHSFSKFDIADGVTVTFTDGGSANVFARVTDEASRIDGKLAVVGNGSANLFLINPHGIVFGANSALVISGSFIASTAESILFPHGERFSTTNLELPILTVSVPTGLQFGSHSGSIINRSRFSSQEAPNILGAEVGLQVNPGKTIGLFGNGIALENGILTANGGHITLGSISGNHKISLSPELAVGYENVSDFNDVYLSQSALLDASGNAGRILIRGRNIVGRDNAVIANFTIGDFQTSAIDIVADESVEMVGAGIFFSPFFGSNSEGADLTISTRRLVIRAGAVISGGTNGLGHSGSLTVEASESVEISGTGFGFPSIMTTSTEGMGGGGDITIRTQRLSVTDGGQIQAVTYGSGKGGNVTVHASEQVNVSGAGTTGLGEEFPSSILASSGAQGRPFQPTGTGGRLEINTGSLLIENGAQVAVNSFGRGDSGDLQVNAPSVRLDNNAQLTTAANFGNGGNLRIQNAQTLVMRRGSRISTRAGAGDGIGNSGNIYIDANFVVTQPFEDSDIVSTATQGQGGNIEIVTRGLYGIAERQAIANNKTNDIDASSEFGISGTTEINQLISESEGELIALTGRPLEGATTVGQRCGASGSRFEITGRGGIPLRPADAIEVAIALVDLGDHNPTPETIEQALNFERLGPAQIEADGWTTNANGEVVLTAQWMQNKGLSELAAAQCRHYG